MSGGGWASGATSCWRGELTSAGKTLIDGADMGHHGRQGLFKLVLVRCMAAIGHEQGRDHRANAPFDRLALRDGAIFIIGALDHRVGTGFRAQIFGK